jgi:hypothetical protein
MYWINAAAPAGVVGIVRARRFAYRHSAAERRSTSLRSFQARCFYPIRALPLLSLDSARSRKIGKRAPSSDAAFFNLFDAPLRPAGAVRFMRCVRSIAIPERQTLTRFQSSRLFASQKKRPQPPRGKLEPLPLEKCGVFGDAIPERQSSDLVPIEWPVLNLRMAPAR